MEGKERERQETTVVRKIIAIDEELCDGCGACATGCPEGALRMIDGKARLVGDLLCDGLGACVGTCPRGAIRVEEREAEPYDERKVMEESILPKGEATIVAHLEHLRDHGEDGYLRTALAVLAERGLPVPAAYRAAAKPACPGAAAFAFRRAAGPAAPESSPAPSRLRQWPVQLHLVNPRAPVFRGANLLLAADCAAFSIGDFHERWLKDRALAIACPKLDEGYDRYVEKLAVMIDEARVDTIVVLRMHVPCCGGLEKMALDARAKATRRVPIKTVVVDPEGTVLKEEWL